MEEPPDELSASNADTQRLATERPTACLNCGSILPGRYCPDCGQKAQPLRIPLHRFLIQSITEFLGLDSRLWSTLGALLFRPGTLTREYLAGRRATYLRPLRVYLSTTLLFFFLLSLIDPVGRARDNLFQSSASTDSVTVAAHVVVNDSILALGLDALADERADVAASRDHLDSLISLSDSVVAVIGDDDLRSDIREAREELDEDREEVVEDSLDLVGRLKRARIERAILAELPPDSLILPDDIHGATRMIVTDSLSFIDMGTDEWLLRNEALRAMAGATTDAERRANLVRFLRTAIGYVPTVLFLILPIFALLLKLLYIRRDWYYSEHLVFGLHTHAFAFVVFIAMTLILWASSATESGHPLDAVLKWSFIGLGVTLPLYFFVAQKRVYGQGWIKTGVKALVLAFSYQIVLFSSILGVLALAAFLG